jgi:hypothetical protein
MEAGRGQEYGGVGGDGGQGVVAVVFSGGFEASTDSLPTSATSHLAVATSASGATALLVKHGTAPYYGGVAKATYRYSPPSGGFDPMPRFFISSTPTPAGAVGTTSFTDDAKTAAAELLDQLPPGHRVEAVALMPCFMRGKNLYGRNDVEPDALAELLPGVAIFGMFCHGEQPRAELPDAQHDQHRRCAHVAQRRIGGTPAARVQPGPIPAREGARQRTGG